MLSQPPSALGFLGHPLAFVRGHVHQLAVQLVVDRVEPVHWFVQVSTVNVLCERERVFAGYLPSGEFLAQP